MPRRLNDGDPGRFTAAALLFIGLISCLVVYAVFSTLLRPQGHTLDSAVPFTDSRDHSRVDGGGGCCRGVDNLELWGSAVKWGTDFKFNSSDECCKACKVMCSGDDGPCLCDSWVFCGDKEACGSKFGECWLKKQKDVLVPARQEGGGQKVMWTSGLIFGQGQGIVGFETEHGVLHVKLHPECAPHSVYYILSLLTMRHCAGCQFHRAENRGSYWDSQGNHINNPPGQLGLGVLMGSFLQASLAGGGGFPLKSHGDRSFASFKAKNFSNNFSPEMDYDDDEVGDERERFNPRIQSSRRVNGYTRKDGSYPGVSNGYGPSSRLKHEQINESEPINEVVSSVKMLTEMFVRVEKSKMEMEKTRMEMELKHCQMMLESQQQIIGAFVEDLEALSEKKCANARRPGSQFLINVNVPNMDGIINGGSHSF